VEFSDYGIWVNFFLVALILFYLYVYPKLRRRNGLDRRRTNTGNPNGKPGKAETCIKHGEKLTELKGKIEALKEDFEEFKSNNRDDHRLIFDKIDSLKNRRR